MKPFSGPVCGINSACARTAIFVFLFWGSTSPLFSAAQAVTGIITDFGGYWKSSQSSVNTVKPDNSHNLLAFTWGGVQYATGANNSLLASHGETFTAGDWWSMNIYSYTGTISEALLALGQMYDGVDNGPGAPPPSNSNFTDYLRDGIKGLDMGTGISNLGSGKQFTFFAHSLNVAKIGDGVPDILITQIAAAGTETYEFQDASGVRIGNTVSVNFTAIAKLGNWTVDFYNVGVTPMTLSSGYTKTDRELRLWAADLSSFGITAANAANVKRFVIHMSGKSDFAFSAYNNQSLVITGILPVTLGYFRGSQAASGVELRWSTLSEKDVRYFVIEKSRGADFQPIDSIQAIGESQNDQQYYYLDRSPSPGSSNYRLKIVDRQGTVKYSPVVSVFYENATGMSMYPNPATGTVTVLHPEGAAGDQVMVFDSAGKKMFSQKIVTGKRYTSLSLQDLPRGIYQVSLKVGGKINVKQLLLQ